MNIWIFQSGEPLHCDPDNPRPMRAMNLANKLVEKGHNVVLWSSAFNHQAKSHRSKTYKKIEISSNLEIRLIPSSGYQKTISLSRFYDHCLLAWNLHKKLKLEKSIPDVGVIGYPPIEASYIMSNWFKKKNVPFILDVKDQWPHILVSIFPNFLKPIAQFILQPYFYIAKRTMDNSTSISAHVPGYIDWAIKFSGRLKNENDKVFPLTVPQDKINPQELKHASDWWANQGIKKSDGLRIIYVGSFSRVYNFDVIFEASKKLENENIKCEFIICGDGMMNENLRKKAKSYNNIKIVHWIDRPKIVALSKISDAAIAPYKNSEDFIVSIPNKIIDTLMLGLPLISSLEGEVKSLIKKHNIGYFFDEKLQLNQCIKMFSELDGARNEFSENAKNLYISEFEFNAVYDEMVLHLEGLKVNE
jgi:glycosyltransferase involved in cell wall biosynthesis